MTKETANPNPEIALMRGSIVDLVAQRIAGLVGEGKLPLPKNYSSDAALTAAWLKLRDTKDKSGKAALSVCTHESVANACLNMIIQGLTPAKDQVYFVVYGDKLVCMRSYFGDLALLARIYPKSRVFVQPVYKGDDFEYDIDRGKITVTKHKQKLENVGGLESIDGAYAVVELGDDNEPHTELMKMWQIEKAWSRGKNWPAQQGKQSAHKDHPEEFVKKTVIARACKRLINASNDSYLVQTLEHQAHLIAEAEMEERIKEEGNKDVIDLPPEENETPEPAERPEKAKEPADEPEVVQEESPTSPAARFLDFIEAYNLDASKARKLAATIRKLKDVRNLGNDDYAAILADDRNYLKRYEKEHGTQASQAKLGGPGF